MSLRGLFMESGREHLTEKVIQRGRQWNMGLCEMKGGGGGNGPGSRLRSIGFWLFGGKEIGRRDSPRRAKIFKCFKSRDRPRTTANRVTCHELVFRPHSVFKLEQVWFWSLSNNTNRNTN